MAAENSEPTKPVKETTTVGDVSVTKVNRYPTMEEITIQAKMTRSEEIGELIAALSKAQGEFAEIKKTGEGHVKGMSKGGKAYDYKYKYATLAAIRESVQPALSGNELAVTQPIVPWNNGWALETCLAHSSGQFVRSWIPVNMGGSPQELGSLLSYFRRYQLSTMLGVAADADDDGSIAEGRHQDRITHARSRPQQQPRQQQNGKQNQGKQPQPDGVVNQSQLKRLFSMATQAEKAGRWNKAQLDDTLNTILKVKSSKELTKKKYDWLCQKVEHSSFDEVLTQWEAKIAKEAAAKEAKAPEVPHEPPAETPPAEEKPPEVPPEPKTETTEPKKENDAPEESNTNIGIEDEAPPPEETSEPDVPSEFDETPQHINAKGGSGNKTEPPQTSEKPE